MPNKNKRSEYRSRILSDDILEPTLFEIDCAAHFFQLGYEIDWFESKSDEHIRTPEFIAKKDDMEIEVECKTKKADAGRRIERRYFYRIVDCLFPIIDKKKLSGFLTITVPSRVPSNSSWYKETKRITNDEINVGEGSIGLPESIILQFNLKEANGKKVGINELGKFHDYNDHPYAHYALKGENENGFIVDPIALKMTSKKTDLFLDNVLDSLRDAEGQFTIKRASIISCMLPEVDDFYGLQNNSAIQKMTYYFFEKYAGEYINAVSYASDPLREVNGLVVTADRPSLSFRNHKYNEEFGPEDIPLY
ncbi:MAG: hypothetical protein U5K99_10660 [Anaerolineales bacterium]|nr:hypothetical protein [Anaerolineales bacterium]